jgi:hypothetical protein
MSHSKGGETPIYIFRSRDNGESDRARSLAPTEPNNVKDKLLKNQRCQTQKVSTKKRVRVVLVTISRACIVESSSRGFTDWGCLGD